MKTASLPLPAVQVLRKLGKDLSVASRKRGISTLDMASRLFVSRDTLWRMEKGDPSVAFGTYCMVLFALGEADRIQDLLDISRDETGLLLDEARLPKRVRSKSTSPEAL